MGVFDFILPKTKRTYSNSENVEKRVKEEEQLSPELIEKFINASLKSNGMTTKIEFGAEVTKVMNKDIEIWKKEIRRPVSSLMANFKVDIMKLPAVPYGLQFYYDLYYYSTILNIIVRSLVAETFRNGFYVKPKYKWKCKVCGTTYNDDKPDRCEICGSDEFVEPPKYEKFVLEKFLEEDVNDNFEKLQDVLMQIDTDLNVLDNAYLIVTKRYYMKNGKIIASEPMEVLRGDPLSMYLIMSKDGRLGMDDQDNVIMTCPLHRDTYVKVSYNDYINGKIPKCPKCGREMKKAVAVFYKWKGIEESNNKKYFYIDGEVLHIKKFTPGFGYGLPPVLSVLTKVLTLMKIDYFIYMAYSLQRPPKGILLIKGNAENIKRAWDYTMHEAYQNPHNIYPLILEADENLAKAKLVEWIDLSYKSDDVDLIEFRNELRRIIGARWAVEPIYHADLSTGSGLANQGLQITVTNRAIQTEHNIFNNKVLPWLSKQLGVNDWVIQLKPHEEKDMVAELQRQHSKVDLALKLKQLGYQPILKEGVDGIDFYYTKADPEEQVRIAVEEYVRQNKLSSSLIDDILNMLKNGGNPQAGMLGQASGVVGVTGEGGLQPEETPSQEGEGIEVPEGEELLEDRDENGRMERPEGAPDGWVARAENQEYEGMPKDAKRKERKDKGQKRNPEEKEGKDLRAEIYNWLKEEGVL